MGKPSDLKRRARLQRQGKRERARVKNPRRGASFCSVVGSGTYRVKAGRKKYGKVSRYVRRVVEAHLAGDSLTSKSGISIKRPTYTIEMSPAQQYRSAWDWPRDDPHAAHSPKEKE